MLQAEELSFIFLESQFEILYNMMSKRKKIDETILIAQTIADKTK